MGRRHRPSLAGWRLTRRPAGLPTAQCLRSAIVVNGAFRSRSRSRSRARRRPGGRPCFICPLQGDVALGRGEGPADLCAASQAQQRLQNAHTL
ncbi:hypothetical protein DMX08_25530 [Pseudomonas protegens]|uniref:Uncharacterized protein n=1 Tax=Pseudomonas protegens TaxID=380021 RepID=A0A9Q6ID68_9PSED|nr:hypothetical protein DMX08_25530 [Pseudomonas protegens]